VRQEATVERLDDVAEGEIDVARDPADAGCTVEARTPDVGGEGVLPLTFGSGLGCDTRKATQGKKRQQ
jgi:hypothetical protein